MHCNLSLSLTVAVHTLLCLQHPDLPPIKKIFYNEHPSVANMEEEEVEKFRYVQEWNNIVLSWIWFVYILWTLKSQTWVVKDLPKHCFLLKVFEYHSCTNELGKIEGKILYKTFLLMWRAATCTSMEVYCNKRSPSLHLKISGSNVRLIMLATVVLLYNTIKAKRNMHR